MPWPIWHVCTDGLRVGIPVDWFSLYAALASSVIISPAGSAPRFGIQHSSDSSSNQVRRSSAMVPQEAWALKRAMQTIGNAYDTESGKATWLLPLNAAGEPFVAGLRAPFESIADGEREYLEGKDWTSYAGCLHTDHCIRPEMFDESGNHGERPQIQHMNDFAYIYDGGEGEHTRLVAGEAVSEEEVFAALSPPQQWHRTVAPRQRRAVLVERQFLPPNRSSAKRASFLDECKVALDARRAPTLMRLWLARPPLMGWFVQAGQI